MDFFSPPTTPRKLPCTKTPLALSMRSVTKTDSSHSRVVKNELNKSPSARKMDHSNDRFIPNRSGIDFDYCNNALIVAGNEENTNIQTPRTPQNKRRAEVLQAANQTPGRRLIDCFDRKTPVKSSATPIDQLKRPSPSTKKRKSITRYLPNGPSKILDAPDLIDDYYLNLLSWGQQNIVAIALNHSVYLWNANTASTVELCRVSDDDYISSVQWSSRDDTLAVGTFSRDVQIYDTSTCTKLRSLPGHAARVSSLSWNHALISSGGKDSVICNHDTRVQHALTSVYSGHSQEICGLAWSPDGNYLASGGNENRLCIWDAAMTGAGSTVSSPRYEFLQHTAAVKALQWCPHQRNVLASGGGTADKTIKLWNINMGTMLSSMNTGSQVCALQWSESNRELVSSHGFSDFEICLWQHNKQQSLTKIRDFKGHTARVLHLAKSPDDSKILSASADETLRFWDILDGSGHCSNPGEVAPMMLSGSMGLR